jgi:hypothetical protein
VKKEQVSRPPTDSQRAVSVDLREALLQLSDQWENPITDWENTCDRLRLLITPACMEMVGIRLTPDEPDQMAEVISSIEHQLGRLNAHLQHFKNVITPPDRGNLN